MPVFTYKDARPAIDETAFIAPNAVLIGDVAIGAGSGIWYGCTLRGDVNLISIGARTNIQDHTLIHVSSFGHATRIGDDVTVGHSALIHACTIENGAFVGMQACVMDGAVVESRAMVAAGALVPSGKTVPSGELWAGRPARPMRRLTDDDFRHMEWSAANYARLAQEYRGGVLVLPL